MYRTLFITFVILTVGKLSSWFAITWLTVFIPLLAIIVVYIFCLMVSLTASIMVYKLMNEHDKQDNTHTTD